MVEDYLPPPPLRPRKESPALSGSEPAGVFPAVIYAGWWAQREKRWSSVPMAFSKPYLCLEGVEKRVEAAVSRILASGCVQAAHPSGDGAKNTLKAIILAEITKDENT